MTTNTQPRRGFLKLAAAGGIFTAIEAAAPDWKKQIGLELYTVRDLLAKDFEGVIAKVAEAGYKELEPVGYGGLDPKAFRALLDRHGLKAPSTHAGVADGPDLEKGLEGHRIMGFKYTEIHAPRQAGQTRQPLTEESVKRSAGEYNNYGKIAAKFGMKVLVHNHAGEFNLLPATARTQYDVLLAETDPKLVAMQMDIGWVNVAGKDPLALFARHPGRFELWHVKDVVGVKDNPPDTPPGRRKGTFVPVGQGEIDYKTIFQHASQAGLKHFVIEQDNAGEKGADSLAAMRANIAGLRTLLS